MNNESDPVGVDNMADTAARRLALLGIILQCLHVIFGITAVLGVLLTQTRINTVSGTIYHSQLRWQFVTFWIGLIGYAAGFYYWISGQNPWIVLAVPVLIFYRIAVSIHAWLRYRSIDRWL